MTVTKREGDDDFPASAFAYVPDPDDPSTWQLRMWQDPDNQVTKQQMRQAIAQWDNAAIPDNDRAKVKRRMLVAWRSVAGESDEIPDLLQKSAVVAALVELRKDGQPSVADVHVNRPMGTAEGRQKRKKLVSLLTRLKGTALDVAHDSMSMARDDSLVVVKSRALQYTFSPLYIPGQGDAHGDWASAEDLQKAVWNLQRSGDRTINVQHLPGTKAGEWVELATWPWEHEADLMVPGGPVRKQRFPANTPWMGVVWEDDAWNLIQTGKWHGLSMEGTARRIMADLPELVAA